MFGAWRPRQMLPPPTTTAIWTPIEVTSTNWSARWPVDAEEMPYGGSAGVNASPESFRSTRRYASVPSAPGAASGASVMDAPRRASGCVWNGSSLRLLAQLEPGEPADRQFLADSSGRLVDQLRDRALVVLHERLVEQHVVLEERVQLPLDDAVEDVLGRPLFAGLPLGHPALGGDHVLRDVLATEPPGLRAGDVQRDVLGQLLELVGVRHEVGLDPALLGHPPCAARRPGEPLLPEPLRGLLDVAAGLLQGALAVHHPRAGGLAQGLHLRGADALVTRVLCHVCSRSLLGSSSRLVAAVAASAPVGGQGSGVGSSVPALGAGSDRPASSSAPGADASAGRFASSAWGGSMPAAPSGATSATGASAGTISSAAGRTGVPAAGP